MGKKVKGKRKKGLATVKRLTFRRVPFTIHNSLFTISLFREKGKR
jgi:hypothetical protein